MTVALLPFALQVLLGTTAVVAGLYDLRYRRIPNRLTTTAAVLGFALNSLFFHWSGLGSSLLGLGIAALAYFPLYLLRGMGAGDVKLMMAIGAIVGPLGWFQIFVVTALCGGLFALCLVLWKRRWQETVWNCCVMLTEICHLRAPHRSSAQLDVSSASGMRLPHGVSIAVGAISVLGFYWTR